MSNQEPPCYGTLNKVSTQDLSADDKAGPSKKFSTRELIALIAICLTHMGDAVEIYLPSILTQNISCEMKLGDFEQGILSMVFYSFYAAGWFLRPFFPYI